MMIAESESCVGGEKTEEDRMVAQVPRQAKQMSKELTHDVIIAIVERPVTSL